MAAYGAWDGDVLAAQYSCLGVNLYVPECDSAVPVGMSINMATHPDYRGRGLIKQVSAPVYEMLSAEGTFAGVGFSNAAGVKVDQNSKGYGYRVIGQMQPLVTMATPFRREPHDFYTTQTFPSRLVFKTHRPNTHFQVTSRQIEHRFGQHPFRTYQYGIWDSGAQGLVVYQNTRLHGVPAVSLLAAYSEDLPGLLSRWLSSIGTRLVYVLTSPTSYLRECLSKLAVTVPFRWSRTPYYLTFKALTDVVPHSLFDMAQWECVGGDVL
jgi:hypothetical protein